MTIRQTKPHRLYLFIIWGIILTCSFLWSENVEAKDAVFIVSSSNHNFIEKNGTFFCHDLQDAIEKACLYEGGTSKVLLYDNVYYLNKPIEIKNNKSKIVIKGINRAIITSGIIINGEKKGDVIELSCDGYSRQLLVNDKSVPITSSFNEPADLLKYDSICKISDTLYTFYFPENVFNMIALGADIFVYSQWQTIKFKVIALDKLTNTVLVSTEGNKITHGIATNSRCSIYNSKKLIVPGSFYSDNNKVFYYPYKSDTSDIDTRGDVYRVPFLCTLIRVENCQNIIFENIVVKNATTTEWYYQQFQVDNNVSNAVEVISSQSISFDKCDFTENMGYCLMLGENSNNCTISGCSFYDTYGGGIRLGSTYNDNTNSITINDNLIKSYGRIHSSSVAIFVQRAHDVIITNNTICDGFYSAISLGWTWGYGESSSFNNYVANNYIHHIMRGVLSDGAAIYTLGDQHGTIIENNYMHDIISYSYPSSASSLLYFDEGTSNLIARNNIGYGAHYGLWIHYGKNIMFDRNVIGFTNLESFRLTRPDMSSNIDATNNFIVNDVGNVYGVSFAEHAKLKDNKSFSYNFHKKKNGKDYFTEEPITDYMSVNNLVRKGYLKHRFKYGVKSKRLQKLSELPDSIIVGDKGFVKDNVKEVSKYFD